MSERDKTPISSRRRALSMTSLALIVVGLVSYSLWTPGADLRDGRHNLGRNALWLGHGWLGDDGWFKRHKKEGQEPAFRDPKRIEALAVRLSTHQITDVYPHLCPTLYDGHVARVDPVQVERFLDGMAGVRVIPWVGGAWGNQASPEDPAWRRRFAASIAALMAAHPRLAGVHINIEPVPEGSEAFLDVLEEVRASLPEGKLLSVSAHPPPLALPLLKTTWSYDYYSEVAARSDQIAVMAYNTGLIFNKLYQAQVSAWVEPVLAASQGASVLMGVPTYGDEGGYHLERVENVKSAILGIHAGLEGRPLPTNFQGLALYSDWEMDQGEWDQFGLHYLSAGED